MSEGFIEYEIESENSAIGDAVGRLDEIVLSGLIDLEKYPIPQSFIQASERYTKERKEHYEALINEVGKERWEIINQKIDHQDQMSEKELDIMQRRIDEIGDTINSYQNALEVEQKAARFEIEVQWKYYLAQTFLSTRGRFMVQFVKGMEDASEAEAAMNTDKSHLH